MSTNLRPVSEDARGKCSGDSRESRALGAELYAAMSRGEETSLALMAGLSGDQMHRQLLGEARLTLDVVMTHLARLDRATALSALEDLLDAHRNRVRPEASGRQIDLFRRLGGAR